MQVWTAQLKPTHPSFLQEGKMSKIMTQISILLLFETPPFRTEGLFRNSKNTFQGSMAGVSHSKNRLGWVPQLWDPLAQTGPQNGPQKVKWLHRYNSAEIFHDDICEGWRASTLEPEVEFRCQETFFELRFKACLWRRSRYLHQILCAWRMGSRRYGMVYVHPPQISKMADGGQVQLGKSLWLRRGLSDFVQILQNDRQCGAAINSHLRWTLGTKAPTEILATNPSAHKSPHLHTSPISSYAPAHSPHAIIFYSLFGTPLAGRRSFRTASRGNPNLIATVVVIIIIIISRNTLALWLVKIKIDSALSRRRNY